MSIKSIQLILENAKKIVSLNKSIKESYSEMERIKHSKKERHKYAEAESKWSNACLKTKLMLSCLIDN